MYNKYVCVDCLPLNIGTTSFLCKYIASRFMHFYAETSEPTSATACDIHCKVAAPEISETAVVLKTTLALLLCNEKRRIATQSFTNSGSFFTCDMFLVELCQIDFSQWFVLMGKMIKRIFGNFSVSGSHMSKCCKLS